MTIEKKELEREREMVTLLLSGSGVAVTSMQDCFIQAGQEDLWSSIIRRGSKGRHLASALLLERCHKNLGELCRIVFM